MAVCCPLTCPTPSGLFTHSFPGGKMSGYSLPIDQRGLFLGDEIFCYAYTLLNEALRHILTRWEVFDDARVNEKLSLEKNLSRYRQLRGNSLRKEDQAVTFTSDSSSHRIVMDVGDFKCEEVKVRVERERELVVEGRKEAKEGDFAVSSHSFRRRFILPHNTNMASIASIMSSDGVLALTIPNATTNTELSQTRNIPIKINNPAIETHQYPAANLLAEVLGKKNSPVNNTWHARGSSSIFGPLSLLPHNSSLALPHPHAGAPRNLLVDDGFSQLWGRMSVSSLWPEEVMPIPKKGLFFCDSLFADAWTLYQDAMRRVLARWRLPYDAPQDLAAYRRLRRHQRDNSQAVASAEDEREYKFVLDVHDYTKDGEVMVFLNGGELAVEGRRARRDSSRPQSFLHHFLLPQRARLDSASSFLSSDGVLAITAPKMNPKMEENCTVIPIRCEEDESRVNPEIVQRTDKGGNTPDEYYSRIVDEGAQREASPTPSVLSDDSCDNLGRLWTFTTPEIQIEEVDSDCDLECDLTD